MQLDYCKIQRVHGQRYELPVFFILTSNILMPQNCIRSGKSCSNVRHFYNILKFRGTFSTLLFFQII